MVKVKDLAIAADKDVVLATDPDAVVVTVTVPHNAPIPEAEDAEKKLLKNNGIECRKARRPKGLRSFFLHKFMPALFLPEMRCGILCVQKVRQQ